MTSEGVHPNKTFNRLFATKNHWINMARVVPTSNLCKIAIINHVYTPRTMAVELVDSSFVDWC